MTNFVVDVGGDVDGVCAAACCNHGYARWYLRCPISLFRRMIHLLAGTTENHVQVRTPWLRSKLKGEFLQLQFAMNLNCPCAVFKNESESETNTVPKRETDRIKKSLIYRFNFYRFQFHRFGPL